MTAKDTTNKQKGFIKLLFIAFLISISLLIIGGITVFALIKDAPRLDKDKLENAQSSIIYDMNGEKIATISGKEYRLPVAIEDVPLNVQQAFIAIEDGRFREHGGIDIKRVGGAILANIKEGWGAEGGSTITQQVVKNTYLSSEKTLERKVQEAYLALKLEDKYSKDEILEIYLNKIYFGHGAYGIGAAAEVYFHKNVKELTVAEAALLAGLPQRPSGYDPFKHPEIAKERRDTVLSFMEKNNFISSDKMKEAQEIKINNSLYTEKKKQSFQYFIDYVIEELIANDISENEIFTGGLKIHTTLDPNAQTYTEKVMTGTDAIPFPDDNFKAGVVLLDTKSGAIRAIGGNRDPKNQNVKRGFNFATDIKRQPGSTIKPILDYGPAIEYKQQSTYHQIKDEEIEINDKTFKNYDDQFHGMVSMREALVKSYNIPAIKTFLEIENDKNLEFASNLGIELEHAYPSYAIGGFGDKDGVSPLDMAGAYAAFGNQGTYHEPYSVTKIEYPSGDIVEYQSKPSQAMKEYTAYMITDMLVDVVQEGTGTLANIEGLPPLAGKTGTTNPPEGIKNGSRDSWFVGYTTDYTAAVWTGYQSTTTEQYVTKEDARLSKLLFKEIMAEVSKNIASTPFTKPDSVIEVEIDKRNGKLASVYTPANSITTELFVEGTELPTKYIPIKPKIENDNEEKDLQESQPTEERNKDKKENKEKQKEAKKEEKEKKNQENKENTENVNVNKKQEKKEDTSVNDADDPNQTNNNDDTQKDQKDDKEKTSQDKEDNQSENQESQIEQETEQNQENQENKETSNNSNNEKTEMSKEAEKQNNDKEKNTSEDNTGTDSGDTEKEENSL
ncbi:multimodular transpeptidase-transglycosylase [Gracilibacillus boraciitolerans JCM 21714]|uniref:Multimodular transpeptidase-transglycosylase n=1 Tax=Gracilibacillus boraciitolerans JCM 21714 TaxID=1298598 RepID=W4VNB2_9BACI|nr:PBP1A family penicillin-binding protein [Gracilibacillus boraciitolerans]GAE94239.1 multimodular transpeptidase-transglycosylase [Gracilibacillus boraciitolerans JCM 21714]